MEFLEKDIIPMLLSVLSLLILTNVQDVYVFLPENYIYTIKYNNTLCLWM